jgi:hypothetical protein
VFDDDDDVSVEDRDEGGVFFSLIILAFSPDLSILPTGTKMGRYHALLKGWIQTARTTSSILSVEPVKLVDCNAIDAKAKSCMWKRAGLFCDLSSYLPAE